ncbi:Flp family type IVb pilin [Roseovarius aestuarii]|uniref:Flp/Fap pilin component n=1 Tax=Roseovarius aestuarii TaxID=475083 RepID=A0A1X7BY93_9RHOB|nr:Flp family type IVb pilin [Roseovarius aestuarii]SMC14470.1 hypothetical protein ROA7745_04337 [Roseovarius aestuarii]
MKFIVPQIFKNLVVDESGVTLVEYGIALSLALLVGTVALTALGGNITGAINAAAALMP